MGTDDLHDLLGPLGIVHDHDSLRGF